MLTVPAPDAANMDGDRLRDELADSGLAVSADGMSVAGGRIVFSDLSDSDRQTVEGAVSRHMGRPLPADPDDEFRAAIEGASTIAELKAALLGTKGPGAEPRQPTR